MQSEKPSKLLPCTFAWNVSLHRGRGLKPHKLYNCHFSCSSFLHPNSCVGQRKKSLGENWALVWYAKPRTKHFQIANKSRMLKSSWLLCLVVSHPTQQDLVGLGSEVFSNSVTAVSSCQKIQAHFPLLTPVCILMRGKLHWKASRWAIFSVNRQQHTILFYLISSHNTGRGKPHSQTCFLCRHVHKKGKYVIYRWP